MIIAIIQARISSSRLPGKIMKDICNKPILYHVVERVKLSRLIDKVIVATCESSNNDVIRDLCKRENILCFSGNEDDVLDRYYQAAKSFDLSNDDIIVRITSDCPMIDPQIIDKVIKAFLNEKADYASNVQRPTFPDGLDCEVFTFTALAESWKNATMKSEREHVTQFMRKYPETFKIISYENDTDLSNYRWTVDQEEDFQLVKEIYEKLYETNPNFLTADVLDLLDKNPELNAINSMYIRNEGLIKSLEEDKQKK